MTLTNEQVIRWLAEQDSQQLAELWDLADRVRRQHVGDAIHLRGLVEISNHCHRTCLYGAPKGRLILPQVQTIRDLLDNDAYCMVVKERELRDALNRLKRPPALVVTDSQAFLRVGADTPRSTKMTSFSILFARIKGDLTEFVRGAMAIDNLKAGAKATR